MYGFAVDDPVPLVPLPLAGSDQIVFDAGAVYNHTFELDDYAQLVVDYSQQPERIQTYNERDRARIQQRMRAIQVAHAQDIDLDALAPLPVEAN